MEADRRAALALVHFLAYHGWPLRVPTGEMSPRKIWSRSSASLAALLRMPPGEHERVTAFRKSFDINRAFEELARAGVTMLTQGEPSYPACLAQIHDPPAAIFISGEIARLQSFIERPRVAIVGARRASTYGIDAATAIAAELSSQNVCVVSGLAAGIDAASHQGALKHQGGTIAVFGAGPDVIYPARNRRLAKALLESGLIVSEYPPKTEPRPWRFPARNRIIAGLSQGVLVVEAKEKSGALITADFALEQGREVFAVPGSIFSELSCGPNDLIRSGARLVTSAADILDDLGIEPQLPLPEDETKAPSGLGKNEQLVLGACDNQPRHQDELAEHAGLDGAATAAALISLEIRGLIKHEPGLGFRRPDSSTNRKRKPSRKVT